MRRLSPEERALWQKVVLSVRPLHGAHISAESDSGPLPPPPCKTAKTPPRAAAPKSAREVGTTLDASWDRRLSRGLLQPDSTVDLHGHNLATAYSLLDLKLEQAITGGARVLLLITGKAPASADRPVKRGAIRAAVGDWLAASRHAGSIAAVRGAHPRHGGAGALYIVLRRRR